MAGPESVENKPQEGAKDDAKKAAPVDVKEEDLVCRRIRRCCVCGIFLV